MKLNIFRQSCMVVFLVLIMPGGGYATEEATGTSLLDGKVFVGHVGPKGGKANGEDELIFQAGSFLSTGCSRYGFTSAPYTAAPQGGKIMFKATTRSPRHGRIEWQGSISGDSIEAVYVWTKDRWYWFDAHEENWFKGQIKDD